MTTQTQNKAQDTRQNKPQNKDFFPTKAGEFVPLLVVYKASKSIWKGFVTPYGETTEADSKELAIKKMRNLANAYKSTVEEYGNPKHLVYAGIGDVEDREVFSHVVSDASLMKNLSEKGSADSDSLYVEAYRN